MIRYCLVLCILSVSVAQFSARLGNIMPTKDGTHNLFSLGLGYIAVESKQMPISIIAEYSFPTSSGVELNVVEFGGGLMYGLSEQFFGVGSLMYSYEEAHGHSHSELAMIIGAAYEFKNHIGLEILYGLNGELKGPRIGTTYHF